MTDPMSAENLARRLREHPTPIETHHNGKPDRDRCDLCAAADRIITPVPARRGEQAEKKGKPINFRPTVTDRANLEAIKKAVPWLASEADAIRYALDAATKKGRRA